MNDEELLTVDDLVTGKAAEQLGEGVIPIAAVLIVNTMTEAGHEMEYVLSEGLPLAHALGMIRSVQMKLERDDLDSWEDEDD